VIDFDDCGFGWFLYDLAAAARAAFFEVILASRRPHVRIIGRP
jgi:Ser/Thr protein kinase RdoA (MazF antagonist)